MKLLLSLLLFTSLNSFAQDSVMIKPIISLIETSNPIPKWYAIDKNQLLTMGLEMTAGYIQGWREEVLYHPNALFRNFPNLNRNFWDNRLYPEGGNTFDANHVGKGIVTALHLVAVVIKVGDIKRYPKKKRVLKVLGDVGKHYIAYQLGFFLSYNVTHKNYINWK